MSIVKPSNITIPGSRRRMNSSRGYNRVKLKGMVILFVLLFLLLVVVIPFVELRHPASEGLR